MSKLKDIAKLGQVIWLDFINRSHIHSGELQRLVDLGIRGVTSNPTIFENAIAKTDAYDQDIISLAAVGKTEEEIYEELVLEDIRLAADVLLQVYNSTNGNDGFVSLEVSPSLANDLPGTLHEATRLFHVLNRPNVMIKIPATPAGIPAIEAAIARGINVNATLIFSLAQYEAVAQAYIAGMRRLLANGGDVTQIASVASFFVSRIDTAVDKILEVTREKDLQGKTAVACAKLVYARFRQLFDNLDWHELASRGARPQRPLWASTGTKNPAYSDTLYVDHLIGPDTVNTLPPATLEAFLDHGNVSLSLTSDIVETRSQIHRLSELGIDLDAITQKLQEDGVAAFAKSFETLLASITEKVKKLPQTKAWWINTKTLDEHQCLIQTALTEMERNQTIPRLWAMDHTLWKPQPTEINNRLGWLHSIEWMQERLSDIETFVESLRSQGYTHALLLGMGGSSLAPEVFRKVFGVRKGYLDLSILDSTNPVTVLGYANHLDPSKTLYIVSTKSGGTIETLSLFKFFYNQLTRALGTNQAGDHFIAITDPGSKLVELADKYHFRETFLNNPNIGGRFSALSYFGLVPAALIGVELDKLLEKALHMSRVCKNSSGISKGENPAATLGATIGKLALLGRNKLTLITSPSICPFGDWVEQLIAESTGKEGKGILPVVNETIGDPKVYGDDRLFIYLRLKSDPIYDGQVCAIENHRHPTLHLELEDVEDLGGQFILWELATAIIGSLLGINPFNQPNVESSKILTREFVENYTKHGNLPAQPAVLKEKDITIYGTTPANSLSESLENFLSQASTGSYIALLAYLPPFYEVEIVLQELRKNLRDLTRLAVTWGYGPRFLHSSGQLHKGDAGQGLFILLTANHEQDAAIPDEAGTDSSSVSFAILSTAQALGDKQALLDAGRKVIHFHLGSDYLAGLTYISQSVQKNLKLK